MVESTRPSFERHFSTSYRSIVELAPCTISFGKVALTVLDRATHCAIFLHFLQFCHKYLHFWVQLHDRICTPEISHFCIILNFTRFLNRLTAVKLLVNKVEKWREIQII